MVAADLSTGTGRSSAAALAVRSNHMVDTPRQPEGLQSNRFPRASSSSSVGQISEPAVWPAATGRPAARTNRTAHQRNFLLILLISLLTAGCQSAAPATAPLSAGELLREYEQSMAGARQKYDGREISVQGFAFAAASLPANSDQGSLWLETREAAGRIGCWFSRQQEADFSQIRSGQHLTIKGVFDGESGVQLKFCRLVKGDQEP